MKKTGFLLYLFLLFEILLPAQTRFPYKNPAIPIDERVKDLLHRMTAEEKFWQLFMIPGDLGKDSMKFNKGLFGFQVSAAAIATNAQLLQYGTSENALSLARKINSTQHFFMEKTRLGIPMIAFDEALHGLVRNGATAFPQAIGLAASFDTALMRKVATAIAEETYYRGIRQVLTPVVNIASDVRWGRTEETYGEDPFLASRMAVAFVSPFEKMGIITTPKHFVANSGDGGRDSYPIHFNERILEEIYFPPFKAAIREGGARSIMTAYNSIDGSPSTASDWLLNRKLKTDWQFSGFVISDASAVGGANVLHYTAKDYADAGKKSITNGLDVIFQGSWEHHRLFIEAFLNGSIPAKRIDDAVARVLKAKFAIGLFDHPYVSEAKATDLLQQTKYKALAKEAAVKSIVLLKNEDNILPISPDIASIAVIGAEAAETRLGGYSGPGNGRVSILDGIKEMAGDKIKIWYAEGVGREAIKDQSIPEKYLSYADGLVTISGLKAEYFNNLQRTGEPVFTRNDKQVDFHWTLYAPDTVLSLDHYSVRWTGTLLSPVSGKYQIGLEGNDGFRLYINNRLIIDKPQKQSYHSIMQDIELKQDSLYRIRVEFYETQGNGRIKLKWNLGHPDSTDRKINEAVQIARKAAAVIVVAGIHEGEFQDRALLSLPGSQEKLIKELAATGKKTVVVLVGGSAITMQNWIDSVKGIIDVWYPGEEGGHAVADILFGKENPSGRLPITFPLHEGQLPLVYNHKPTGRGDDYYNLSGQPLFPFGYGLSYSGFSYAHIELEKKQIGKKDSVKVSALITNTGTREGDEVVQLYIRDLLSSVSLPVQELKGFQRIHLKPGESQKVSFLISPDLLEMLNDKMQKVVEPGDFRIMIGSSSKELWLKDILRVR